ncbi:MAG: hypothetical protein C5B50_17725 [Verrucomicrobia bacterium]|nr:MAG: hypothetical protein C5B50_17725 [Verrucomicrobiota bacterium]
MGLLPPPKEGFYRVESKSQKSSLDSTLNVDRQIPNKGKSTMKKSILILSAALALALVGCSEQGGSNSTGEQPNSSTNLQSTPSSQGGSTAPGGANSGGSQNQPSGTAPSGTSTNNTPPSQP